MYWSRAYNCLFPGTIEDLEDVVLNKENMVQVLLDDGDRRQVELGSVRMLPNNYSHVGKSPTKSYYFEAKQIQTSRFFKLTEKILNYF